MTRYNINTYNKKIKNTFINYLVIFFLIHGFLFFVMPNEIYDDNSPIRYIKYIVLMVILALVFLDCKLKKILTYFMIIVLLLIANMLSLGIFFGIRQYLVYIIPLITFFMYDSLYVNLNHEKIACKVYIISSILSYIEFFVYNGIFFKFSSSGYRVISIFVNPNNFGIIITLLTIYLIEKITNLNRFYKITILINSFLLIFLSGSKTALISFLFIIIYYFIFFLKQFLFEKLKIKLKTIFIIIFCVFLLTIMLFIFTNKFSFIYNYFVASTRSFETMNISAMTRYNEYIIFFSNCDNIFFPWMDKINYIDNIYMHIWGTFGIIIFFLFLMFNEYIMFYAIIKNKKSQVLLLFVLLLSGITTNILYIWPISYLYWYLCANILDNNSIALKYKGKY